MREKKGNSGSAQENADPNAWMVTFADLIMLLLTFFVLLLTMKSMDSGALKERFQELAPTSGPLDFSDVTPGGSIVQGSSVYKRSMVISNNRALQAMLDLLEGIERQKAKEHHLEELLKIINIKEDNRGVVIVMECDQLFDSGKAEIRSDRFGTLDEIGRLFRYVSNDIHVVGHTDNRPIQGGGAFASNLELSAYRALSVVFYLTGGLGLKAKRFSAGGLGDLLPQYSNETDTGRAKNRRVEFVLKKPR
jgi:chemotaxis protein MotB